MTRCAILYCSAPALATSRLCRTHQRRATVARIDVNTLLAPETPAPPTCRVCIRRHYARGLCYRHYHTWWRQVQKRQDG